MIEGNITLYHNGKPKRRFEIHVLGINDQGSICLMINEVAEALLEFVKYGLKEGVDVSVRQKRINPEKVKISKKGLCIYTITGNLEPPNELFAQAKITIQQFTTAGDFSTASDWWSNKVWEIGGMWLIPGVSVVVKRKTATAEGDFEYPDDMVVAMG